MGSAGGESKLDQAFFKSLIRRDNNAPKDLKDFDVYLMEKGLMPLLQRGLDALARKYEKINEQNQTRSYEDQRKFNPKVWLAQYLLRNHPSHLRDNTSRDAPNYAGYREWALIEKGRRELQKRKHQVEQAFAAYERTVQGQRLNVLHMPNYVEQLDEMWNLNGQLSSQLKIDWKEALGKSAGSDHVGFDDFWDWFENFFENADILRTADFEAGAARRREEEERNEAEREERERREQRQKASAERRSQLLQQFEALVADLNTDDEVLKILNQGAVLSGVEDEENAVNLEGDHIAWIKQTMRLWDVDVDQGSNWNDASLASWRNWAARYTQDGAAAKVDAANLGILIGVESYTNLFLARMYPTDAEAAAQGERGRTLEVQHVADDGVDCTAEVIDDETGEVYQVSLPDELYEEVKARLGNKEAVMANVNLGKLCVLGVA